MKRHNSSEITVIWSADDIHSVSEHARFYFCC